MTRAEAAEQNELLAEFRGFLDRQELISVILARPHRSFRDAPRKQTVRPVTIKSQLLFQWEQQFDRQQTHVNRTAKETADHFSEVFPEIYQEVYFFTRTVDLVARVTPRGITIQRKAPRELPQAVTAHDRKKAHLLAEGTPVPFLVELGVMTPEGKVKQDKQKKFRQINRYLEMINDVVDDLPKTGVLKIVDFGCGLSYLTFALHDLFHRLLGREVDLLGIDQNPHVIERCQAIAGRLNTPGIRFQSGKIETAAESESPDLTVSLHACDTATDQALAYSVSVGAKVILAAPCCQHELAKKIQSSSLEGMLKFGAIKERFASLATDSLRAAALEVAGYRTQILEFIELEHTPKNLLIRAVRKEQISPAATETALQRYRTLKDQLGGAELAVDQIISASNISVSNARDSGS